jgi:small-conductance mechanosensitive channel
MSHFSLPSSFSPAVFDDLWKYDVLHISGNAIKVSNIVIAIIVLFIGIKFTKKITQIILKVLSKKFHDDPDTAHTINRLVSYSLLILNIFISLQIANIPLGIFTFIGGAFAIGIGLGAQGIVSSFINTIVIMIEKPVKIGDVIEIQETIGRVKFIGTRCITISSVNSEEILIPNSMLMQNKLSKWTHENNKTSYYVYINILKEKNLKINHDSIIKQLDLVTKDLDFITNQSDYQVYLTKIAKAKDQFRLSFLCNANLVKCSQDIRNKLNLALLKHLKTDFTVEYSKNLG